MGGMAAGQQEVTFQEMANWTLKSEAPLDW